MLQTHSKDTNIKSKSLHAVEENLSRFWADLGTEMHFSIEKTQLFTNIKHPYFNGIIRSNIPSTIASKRVSEIVHQFNSRELPFHWVVSNHAKPSNIRDLLSDKGLEHTASWAGLYHPLKYTPSSAPNQQNISIQPVSYYDMMMIWAVNFAESMDIPFKDAKRYADLFTRQGVKPFRHFIALKDGVCVGVATIYFLSNIVGIYNLSIKKSALRQGVGASIVSYLLNHAKKIQAEGVVLYVPCERQATYLHMGFEHVTDFDVFEYPH